MKKRKSAQLITLVLTIMLLSGCGGKKQKDHVIDISISKSYGTATSNIIREYDLFKDVLPDGYTVEWHEMTSASDMRDALVAGELDFVCTSLPTYIAGFESGMPLRLVSFAGGVPIGVYGNKDSIYSLSDIGPDDRIAAKSKGNNGHIAFLIACEQDLGDAMALDDQIVTVQEADALALLQSSDDCQASLFSFPMTVKAQNAGLKEIRNLNQIIEDYGIGSTYFTRDDYYEDNPEIIKALKAAQQKALELIENDPEGVSETLSKVFELDSADIQAALEQMPPHTEYTGYDKLARQLYSMGLVDHEPTAFKDLPNYEDVK